MAAKVLAIKLLEMLNLSTSQDKQVEHLIPLYIENRLTKVYNYGCSIWAENTKHSDGRMIEDCLKKHSTNDLDDLMGLE